MKNKYFLFYIIFSSIYFINYHFSSVHAETSCKTSIIQDGKTATNFNNNTDISGGDIRWISNIFHSFSSFNIGSESIIKIAPHISGINSFIIEVTGDVPSWICGTLSSIIPNVKIYLINPNGVFFGPDYQLNLNGTLHIITSDNLIMKQINPTSITANELEYLINILQTIAGMTDSFQIDFDLYSDNVIGLQECIYLLQQISGLSMDLDSLPAYPLTDNKYIDHSNIQVKFEPERYLDSDHDGFTDEYEKYIFGSLDQVPGGDFNNDGFSNLIEYNWATGRQTSNNHDDVIFQTIQWLEMNQNKDGSWGKDLKPLNTSEVVIALRSVNQTGSAYYKGISWLESHRFSNTDFKARGIMALSPNNDNIKDRIDSIFASFDNSESWGLSKFYSHDFMDTALVLKAVAYSGLTYDVSKGLMYLEEAINAELSPVVMSYVIQSLLKYEQDVTLIVNKLADKDYSNASLITKANIAIALYESKKSDDLYNSILSKKNINGSWDNDFYATALILKLIAIKKDMSPLNSYCEIPDSQLQAAINFSLGKSATDSLTIEDMKSLKYLNASNFCISDLNGLEHAINLQYANFQNTRIINNFFEILNQLPGLIMTRSGNASL